MNLQELFEREEDLYKQSYSERRKKLIAKVAEMASYNQEKLRDPSWLMTTIKSILSVEPFAHWSEKSKRSMLHDAMEAFGITPDDRDVSSFIRY